MNFKNKKAFVDGVFLEDWSQTRRKGRRRFVWLNATLWCGVFAGVHAISEAYKGQFSLTFEVPFALFAAAGGYLVGTITWKHHEKVFLENTPNGAHAPTSNDTPGSS